MANNTGLRIRNGSSNEMTLNTDTLVTRIVGQIETGTNPGSYTIPPDIAGSSFFFFTTSDFIGDYWGPTLIVSGRTVSWIWQYSTGLAGNKQSATVHIGSMG